MDFSISDGLFVESHISRA